MSDEGIMDTSEMFKKMKELTDKANKYDNVRQKYVDIAKKINDGIDRLNEAMLMMDPVLNISKPHGKRTNVGLKVREECWQRMQMGLEVTNEWLVQEYPDEKSNYLTNLFQQMKKMNGVRVRKDGRTAILYIEKNIGKV